MKRILRKQEVADLIGVSLMTLWRWERAGDFPRHVKLGRRGSVGYLAEEVDAWIEARAQEREVA